MQPIQSLGIHTLAHAGVNNTAINRDGFTNDIVA
jgi:hypothetical protein